MCEALNKKLEEVKVEGRIEGRTEGRTEGILEGIVLHQKDQIAKKLAKGKTLEVIAEEMEESVETIRQLM